MKLFENKKSAKGINCSASIVGAVFIYAISFNSAYACKTICKEMKSSIEESLFVPRDCDNKDMSKSRLDQMINFKLAAAPEFINSEREVVPGDQFKPNRKIVPGDQFKPKRKIVPGDQF